MQKNLNNVYGIRPEQFLLIPFVIALSAVNATESKCDAKCDEIVHQMADAYSKARSFSVGVHFYRVVQSPGNKSERWVNYDVAVQRPNKLSFILKDGDQVTYAWVCDGASVITYMAGVGKYIVKRAPETLDELFRQEEVTLIKGTMENFLFLDCLLKDKPYDAILGDVQSATYAGVDNLGQAKVHRLQFVGNDNSKWDLCVENGAQPLIRSVTPDLSSPFLEPGKPAPAGETSITMTFDEWSMNQKIPDERFKFVPPASAKKSRSFFKEEDEKNALIGQPAPSVKLTLAKGGTVDLASFKGKRVVVLDFWATWCLPCVKALPTMDALAETYRKKGVVFYAVNSREKAETVQSFLEFRKLDLSAVLDQDGAVFKAFGITRIPRAVIIDKKGVVQACQSFLRNDVKTKLAEELDTVLAGKDVVNVPEEDDEN